MVSQTLTDAVRSRRVATPVAAGRIAAVVNPATHGDAAAIVDRLRREAPGHVTLDVRVTPAAGTTTAVTHDALAAGAELVVAVGGDGTVAAVATALRGTAIPLAIIPGGSTNITARELGIPSDPGRAVAVLFGPHRLAALDVGLCGEMCFLHMAGAGLDSRMFAGTHQAVKRQIGWLAYVPPAVHYLGHPLVEFTIVADGQTIRTPSPLVLVANGSAIITPRLPLYPGIRPDDGLLDLLIFTLHGPLQAARTVNRVLRHGLAGSRHVQRLRARQITLTSDPVLPVELDGDVVTRTPVTLRVDPAALAVVVPLVRPLPQ